MMVPARSASSPPDGVEVGPIADTVAMRSIVDERGYVQFHTAEGESVYRHQLVSLLRHPPDEVFTEDREVHHMAHVPFPGVVLDVGGAVLPVDRSLHRSLHGTADVVGDAICPPIGTVLDRDDK